MQNIHCQFWLMIGACLISGAAMSLELDDMDWERLGAGEVVVKTDKVDGTRRVEAAIVIEQPSEAIWQVMLDCPNAPEFVPNMKSCEVLEQAEDASWEIIEHQVKYGWLAPKTVYQFRAEYKPLQQIHFERISGDLKHLEGDWMLEPVAGLEGYVLVSYSVFIDPGFLVPGFITRGALKDDLPDVMQSLRERVAQVQSTQSSADDKDSSDSGLTTLQ